MVEEEVNNITEVDHFKRTMVDLMIIGCRSKNKGKVLKNIILGATLSLILEDFLILAILPFREQKNYSGKYLEMTNLETRDFSIFHHHLITIHFLILPKIDKNNSEMKTLLRILEVLE